MELTLQLDDEVVRELQHLADQQGIALPEYIARTLRHRVGSVARDRPAPMSAFRQQTFDMGRPKFDVKKALAFAGELEDEEIIAKMRDLERRSQGEKPQ